MVIALLLLFVLLALMGVLGFVLKVALAVAIGLVLGVFLVAGVVWWRIRRALFGSRPRWRRVRGSSTVEVLDRHDRYV